MSPMVGMPPSPRPLYALSHLRQNIGRRTERIRPAVNDGEQDILWRLLLDALALRRNQDQPADGRPELGDDLAYGGREDVDAAHDQHVVGAADAADTRRGAAAGAG